MIFKKLLLCVFIFSSTLSFAQEPAKFKLYGFIGNDFMFNSRRNVEMVDGLVQLFPLPISLDLNNKDINAAPQAEFLSINTRLGLDIAGTPLLRAISTGKIEADFAGFGTTFYVFRIRQAYVKLNWAKSELLLGQTWHPLFGSMVPTTFSINGGAPFQPFNRCPQLRFKHNLTPTLTVTAAALYQMQYASQGPLEASNVYLKNALVPNVFLGMENKTSRWINGAGVDFKTIKPDATNRVSSLSAVAYSQYTNKKFQLKAKAVLGENLSDQLMLGGYGASSYSPDSTRILSYTNFNNMSTWVNAVYGNKLQVGMLVGVSQNLGTNKDLALSRTNKFTNYGFGFYDQVVLDRLYRIAPQVSYNLQNIRVALEYDLTSASYGAIQRSGRATTTYSVNNHRVLASVMYIF